MSASTPHADGVEVVARDTVFQGYFRVDRYVLRHRSFAGGWTAPMMREVFERGHAAAVLLYDPDRDQVGLIEQFRPGAFTAGIEPWLIEIVAGVMDEGETPAEVAVREAQEEAGAAIADLLPIGKFIMSPGACSETVEVFCARIDASRLDGLHGLAAEGEDIRVFAMPADEAVAWVSQGRIVNASTALALLWLGLHKDEVRKKWGAGA